MPAELLWGDSNAGNFLFADDGSVVVAVDFEAASVGPGEIDLAWWFFLERMLSGGNSLPEGMPDKAEQIAIYERALGRPVVDLGYFDILAALRMSLVTAQTVRLMIDRGRLDAANRTADFNPAVSMLAGLIGVDHDPRMDHYMQFVGAMNQR
jgi:aminoglycoside phosphotransferase (APT) family kinase protein